MMLTVRTPLRVSLFGGGSDYPEWYASRGGAVIGFTIDKYIYLSALRLTAFVDYRFRLTYSKLELRDSVSGIEHPAVRAILEREGFDEPLDCSVQADLPANAGLGSSSAFVVGFLNLVSALQDVPRTKLELARLAIEIEHDVLHERVGIQDQLHAAFGGLNRFDFEGDRLGIQPLATAAKELDRLADSMLLVYTGIKRHASPVVAEQLENTAQRRVDALLEDMLALVDEGQRLFESKGGDDLALGLAELLDEGWKLKRGLSSQVSNEEIDDLYARCRQHGALGGKLCGAGGGGFLLVVVPSDRRLGFVEAFGPDRCVPFHIEHSGSVVRRHW